MHAYREVAVRPLTFPSSYSKISLPVDWDHYNELIASRNAGAIEETAAELAQLAEAEPDVAIRAVVLMELANSFVLLNRFSDARDKLSDASKVVGPDHQIYLRIVLAMAVVDTHACEWKSALCKLDALVKDHDFALRSDENSDVLEEVTRNRGIVLVEMERFQEARPLLDASRAVAYQRERTLCSLGMANFALKDFNAAQRDFEELLSLAPKSVFQAYAHYYLGKIFYQRGQLARAKSALEECLACPDRGKVPDKVVLQGLIYCSQGLNLNSDATRYSEMLKDLYRESL